MKHVTALAIKFISSLVLLYILLGVIYGLSFTNVFLITMVLGITSYLIGDLLILPRTNNMIATFSDFGLALIVIWVMTANLTTNQNTFAISLISALGIALFELILHKYVAKYVIDETPKEVGHQTEILQYQTEASEELYPESDKNKKKKMNDYIKST